MLSASHFGWPTSLASFYQRESSVHSLTITTVLGRLRQARTKVDRAASHRPPHRICGESTEQNRNKKTLQPYQVPGLCTRRTFVPQAQQNSTNSLRAHSRPTRFNFYATHYTSKAIDSHACRRLVYSLALHFPLLFMHLSTTNFIIAFTRPIGSWNVSIEVMLGSSGLSNR